MKKNNLDAYVSFVQSMHVSTASRRRMMQKLCADAEEREQHIRRTKEPSAAWHRFERISGLAAMLIVGISAGVLVYETARTVPPDAGTSVVCSVPEQFTDAAFSDYFDAVKKKLTKLPGPNIDVAAAVYSGAIEKQQDELDYLQRSWEKRDSRPDDDALLNPWGYLTPANTMRKVLTWCKENTVDSMPLRTFGIGYCEEEQLLYFTLVNLSDEDAVFRTDITLRDYDKEQTLAHDNAALPLWQHGFLEGYLCETPLRALPDEEGYCITIPAHEAAELTLHIPADTDIKRDRLALDFYSLDDQNMPAYTKYFEMNGYMLLMPREQEAALLDFAAEHSKLEY